MTIFFATDVGDIPGSMPWGHSWWCLVNTVVLGIEPEHPACKECTWPFEPFSFPQKDTFYYIILYILNFIIKELNKLITHFMHMWI